VVTFEEVYLTAHTTPAESRERGLRCRFIRINEQWGMKFYKNENYRNKTYDFQNRAAEAGLAPRVGECFELALPFYDDDEPIEVFGYVTECISETYGERMAYKIYNCSYEECHEDEQQQIDIVFYDEYEYGKLIEEINSIGISTEDTHSLNFGYLRGKLVCIDFSEEREI
jgi:hypothetical protein